MTYMNASLRVEEDRTVLLRSTETKSDAANGMNQRIVLTAVDLPPDTADIDIDDVVGSKCRSHTFCNSMVREIT